MLNVTVPTDIVFRMSTYGAAGAATMSIAGPVGAVVGGVVGAGAGLMDALWYEDNRYKE